MQGDYYKRKQPERVQFAHISRSCQLKIQMLTESTPHESEMTVHFFQQNSPVQLPTAGNGVHYPVKIVRFRRPSLFTFSPSSFCSFRMTDIWRSFVAQRCLCDFGGKLTLRSAAADTGQQGGRTRLNRFRMRFPVIWKMTLSLVC